jgi:hypothetical protein
MLRKTLTIALAIMLVSAITAFACGGDKTADNQKASTEKYTGNEKADATVQKASVTSEKSAHDCPYMKEMNTASAVQGEEATVKQADYSGNKASDCTWSKEASTKSASATKSADCAASCVKSKEAKEASNPATKDLQKVDADKTVMVDQKEAAGDM